MSPSAGAQAGGGPGPGRFGGILEAQSPGREHRGAEAGPERGNSHGWVLGSSVDSGSEEEGPSWPPLHCSQASTPPGRREHFLPFSSEVGAMP